MTRSGSNRGRLLRRALYLLLSALLVSCVGTSGEGERSSAPPGHRTAVLRLVLTAAEPSAAAGIDPGELRRQHPVLLVSIGEVRNPDKVGFDVFVRLDSGADDLSPTTVPLGRFSVFPPDSPGDFVLRTTRAYVEMERMEGSLPPGTRLVLEVKPIHGDRLPEPFEVVVDSLRWLEEPE